MVDVLELQGSTDDLLLEDGSGQLVLESMRQTFSVVNTVSNGSIVITTSDDIPVGATIILGTVRTITGGQTTGVNTITDSSGNTWSLNDAESVRASTYDIAVHSCLVTTMIPAGSTITVFQNTAASRKVVVGVVFADLVGTLDQTSGNNAGGDGATSAGANGSSATPSATTAGATTVPDEVVISVVTYGGTSDPPIPGSGYTTIAAMRTDVGSTDRGLMMQYKVVSTTGSQTGSATNDASGGWTAAVATYPISPPASVFNKGAFFALL